VLTNIVGLRLPQVHSVLNTFRKFGYAKQEAINADEVEESYINLLVMMDNVIDDDYHGRKLIAMLNEWASIGM
jgi:hypothetical protein